MELWNTFTSESTVILRVKSLQPPFKPVIKRGSSPSSVRFTHAVKTLFPMAEVGTLRLSNPGISQYTLYTKILF